MNIYLLLLVLVIPTSIAAWIVRLRMRRRVQMALGSKPDSEVELTSLSTWMRVDEQEERSGQRNTPEGAQCGQDAALLTTVDLGGPALDMHSPARQGRRLVLPLGLGLPPFCLRCGKPASTYKELTLSWFPEAGDIPYVLIGIVVHRNVTVSLPLCSTHFWRRLALKIAGVLSLLAAILLGAIAGDDMGAGFAVGLLTSLLTFTAGAYMWWRSEVLHIRHLDDNEIVFTGACEEFLNILPLRHHPGT